MRRDCEALRSGVHVAHYCTLHTALHTAHCTLRTAQHLWEQVHVRADEVVRDLARGSVPAHHRLGALLVQLRRRQLPQQPLAGLCLPPPHLHGRPRRVGGAARRLELRQEGEGLGRVIAGLHLEVAAGPSERARGAILSEWSRTPATVRKQQRRASNKKRAPALAPTSMPSNDSESAASRAGVPVASRLSGKPSLSNVSASPTDGGSISSVSEPLSVRLWRPAAYVSRPR